MDRWDTGVAIFALLISSGLVFGLVVGLASKVPEHGLPLLKSTMIVACAGIVATLLFAPFMKKDMFLLAPLVGVIVGGIVVVLVGMSRTNPIRSTKPECEKTVSKA